MLIDIQKIRFLESFRSIEVKYFVFKLNWSPSDYDYVIVEAPSEHVAREKVSSNARYVMLVATSDRIIR
jgi:Mrp family chromosome partitioning ATPase